jgi:hypothetical protein
MHATTRAAGGDALQALHRHFAEVRRKIRDDEELIFLREATGLGVVFGERRVFVAQIHLRDLLDVFVEVGEALLDLRLLRPDAAVDEALLKIREMHDAGKVLAEADRIKDRERQSSGRRAGEQAQDEIVQRADDLLVPGGFRLEQHRGLRGHGNLQRHGELADVGQRQFASSERDFAELFQVHGERTELRRVEEIVRHAEGIPALGIPRREQFLRFGVGLLQGGERRQHHVLPFGFDGAKTLVARGGDAIQVFRVAAFERLRPGGGLLVQLRGLLGVAFGDAVQLHAAALVVLQAELACLIVEAIRPVVAQAAGIRADLFPIVVQRLRRRVESRLDALCLGLEAGFGLLAANLRELVRGSQRGGGGFGARGDQFFCQHI